MATRLNNCPIRSDTRIQRVYSNLGTVRRRWATINYRDSAQPSLGKPCSPPPIPILSWYPWFSTLASHRGNGSGRLAAWRPVYRAISRTKRVGRRRRRRRCGIDIQPFPSFPSPPCGIGLPGTSRNDGAGHLDKCNLVGAAALLSLDSGFSADDECCHRGSLLQK